ncbi:GNAT family N-acetyltransferase [Polymorphospora sp. NPDC050346]|uniref:GNAT family N-acetyltransferase n=1 Tax=Polymorphospora sp. NPDC050346 TaxID=3155780 RepID=UPI0033F92346
MLRQQDVGHRVVVRRIVGVRNDRALYSDALGELVDLTETHLTIATSTGPLSVPLTEVHRAKRVPASRRPTAADVVALELAANEAWPAPDQDRLGDWLLRSAQGWTGRGNSALPVGDPDRPLDAAVDAVQDWYATRGQPAMINVPLPLAGPVGVALDERGWDARPLTLVRTTGLTDLLAVLPPRDDLPEARLEPAPSADWLAVAAGRKGGLPDAAHHLLTAVDRVCFVHLHDDGELVGTARGTITGGGRWLGIGLVEVVPTARRRGLAAHMIGALARWAAGGGATDAFLQVEERNTPAVTLYGRLGFTTHHTYLTRVAP